MPGYSTGPIALARDSRFKDGDVDEAIKFLPKEGYLTLEPKIRHRLLRG
jgi:hypothetical protein